MSWIGSPWLRLVLIAALIVLLIASVVDGEWLWAAFTAVVLLLNLGGLHASRRRRVDA